jgi:hypothetical protein
MSHIAQTLSELSEARNFNSYLSYLHAQDYQWRDDDMSDDFDEWLSEITDEAMTEYLWWFLRQIDKRIPGWINWWIEWQTFIPKIK